MVGERTQIPVKPVAAMAPITQRVWGTLQRKCACGGSGGAGGDCEECKKKSLQRWSTGQFGPATVPPIVHGVLRSPGQPLDAATRTFFEPRFGHDFSRVRVHTDAQAAESARAVNAVAYTVGQHVSFAPGSFQPRQDSGRRLLAHELAHTVQQGGGAPAGSSLRIEEAGSPSEREADEAARVIGYGGSYATQISQGHTIARQTPAPAPGVTPPSPPVPDTPPSYEHKLDDLNLAAPVKLEDYYLSPGDVSNVGGKKYVVYENEVREGGSVTWVTRNPGAIRMGDRYGAFPGKKFHTAQAGDFAIFPEEATGMAAIVKVLRGYGHVTVAQALSTYAPATDRGNDPGQYARIVAQRLGVSVDTYVDTLSQGQLATFADQIKSVEGWTVGTAYARDDARLPEEIRKHLFG